MRNDEVTEPAQTSSNGKRGAYRARCRYCKVGHGAGPSAPPDRGPRSIAEVSVGAFTCPRHPDIGHGVQSRVRRVVYWFAACTIQRGPVAHDVPSVDPSWCETKSLLPRTTLRDTQPGPRPGVATISSMVRERG